MITDLKPYAVMKDLGVPWLGEVPGHWELLRNGQLFAQRNETGFPDLPILEVSLKTGVRVRTFESSNRKQIMADREKYKRARKGDVTYNMMRMWQGAVGVAPLDGLVSPAYVVARPLPETDSRYYEYLFRVGRYMDETNKFSRGIVSDRNRLYWQDFKQMPSPFPPSKEQAAIVRFLDYVDRRIRRYIRATQKLIKLLEEQKQAIVHRAVTRGLDPNVRLNPSGVEWLGDVPEHWDLRRLKSLVRRIDQGVSPQAENYLVEGDAWGVLKAGCVNRGVFRETEHKRLPVGFEFDPSLVVEVGDTLVSRASGSPHLVGSVGRVPSVKYKLILSDKTFRPVFNQDLEADFMVLAMNSRYYRQQVERAISGAEGLANNLPLSSLRAFVFVIPPVEEQRTIIEYLRKATDGLRATGAHAEAEIALLREYRIRLIADVVTGKLDVRAAAANLLDESDEPEALDDTDALPEGDEPADGDLDAAPEDAEA